MFTCPFGTAVIYLVANSLFCYVIGMIEKSFWLFEFISCFIPFMISVGWRQNHYASKTMRGDVYIALIGIWTVKQFTTLAKSRKYKFGT